MHCLPPCINPPYPIPSAHPSQPLPTLLCTAGGYWAQQGYCRSGQQYYTFMQLYCKKSCNTCNQCVNLEKPANCKWVLHCCTAQPHCSALRRAASVRTACAPGRWPGIPPPSCCCPMHLPNLPPSLARRYWQQQGFCRTSSVYYPYMSENCESTPWLCITTFKISLLLKQNSTHSTPCLPKASS